MKVLVTGAAGFLGRRLIHALLGNAAGLPGISSIVAADVAACPIDDARVDVRVGTLTDPGFVSSLVDGDTAIVYHLAAVLSGQSEAEFDVGMRVNVEATYGLLETCRRAAVRPRFVFASTIAVFGGPLPDIVPEEMAPRPQSSYGTEKAIVELLVGEYSRRAFIDGIAARLPTVAIRPGTPNSAMSSFVSGIVREPLAGVESVCPVPLDTPIWISSPGVVTANLVHAARVPSAALGGLRVLNLPGLTVTPGGMLASLEQIGGAQARARVRCEPDERVARVVCTWPAALDARRALRFGFIADADADAVVREYVLEQRARSATASGP